MLANAHQILAWVVIALNAAAGIWATAAHWQQPLQRRELWWFITAAQILLFVQVALGVARLQQLGAEPDQFHLLYGFCTLIAVAILYSYRHQVPQIKYLLYGGGSLFIMGLALRTVYLDAVV